MVGPDDRGVAVVTIKPGGENAIFFNKRGVAFRADADHPHIETLQDRMQVGVELWSVAGIEHEPPSGAGDLVETTSSLCSTDPWLREQGAMRGMQRECQ